MCGLVDLLSNAWFKNTDAKPPQKLDKKKLTIVERWPLWRSRSIA